MDIKILYEDKDVLVAIKPSGVPSQPDKTGDKSMMDLLTEYLKGKCSKSNDIYLGLIHRLDRPVGGIMIFAKTKLANSKLSNAVRENKINKKYYAVTCGEVKEASEELKDYLLKNAKTNMSTVVSSNTKNSKEAILKYNNISKVLSEEFGELTLLEVELVTGRHHQIRVQFSNKGFPLWGDNKYNEAFKKIRGWSQIALWSCKLEFIHPITGKEMVFFEKPSSFPFSLF